MNRKSGLTETAQLLRIVSFVAVVAALYFGRSVFIPLALAMLLSLLLAPVMTLMTRLKVPRLLGLLVVAAILGCITFGLAWKLSIEFTDLSDQLPTYKSTLEEKIQSTGGLRNTSFSRLSDALGDLEADLSKSTGTESRRAAPMGSSPARPVTVKVVPPSNTMGSVESVLGSMGAAGMVIIFLIFILVGREDLRNRLIHLTSGGRLTVVTQAVDEATRRVQRYLLLQSAVNAMFGITVGVGLSLIGIPEAWLWGLLAAILRFLPYVGAVASGVIPIVLSLAAFSGWSHALITIAFFVVLEIIVANFVEPLLYGAQVGLSPLAILVSAVFWTLIWGFPGLILATPLTVTLVVMARYVPSLAFLKVLLGDQPEISPVDLYYQRLLATDPDEARQIADQYLRENSLAEVYGKVLIPALCLVEQDRQRNELDETTVNFILQSAREFAEDSFAEDPQQGSLLADGSEEPSTTTEVKGSVLCLPARGEGDEIAGLLLSQTLERLGISSQYVSSSPLADKLSAIEDAAPDCVCISALCPFALEHTRATYQKIRAGFPDLVVVVCLWQFEGDVIKAQRRLKVNPSHPVVFTLADATQAVILALSPAAAEKAGSAGDEAEIYEEDLSANLEGELESQPSR